MPQVVIMKYCVRSDCARWHEVLVLQDDVQGMDDARAESGSVQGKKRLMMEGMTVRT